MTSLYTSQTTIVLVFKTSLLCEKDIRQMEPVLNAHPGILRWNVDRHDIDNVLRIETKEMLPREIISLLNRNGFFCEELPD